MSVEFNEEKEIDLINSVIREAIVHGSDNGGHMRLMKMV